MTMRQIEAHNPAGSLIGNSNTDKLVANMIYNKTEAVKHSKPKIQKQQGDEREV